MQLQEAHHIHLVAKAALEAVTTVEALLAVEHHSPIVHMEAIPTAALAGEAEEADEEDERCLHLTLHSSSIRTRLRP